MPLQGVSSSALTCALRPLCPGRAASFTWFAGVWLPGMRLGSRWLRVDYRPWSGPGGSMGAGRPTAHGASARQFERARTRSVPTTRSMSLPPSRCSATSSSTPARHHASGQSGSTTCAAGRRCPEAAASLRSNRPTSSLATSPPSSGSSPETDRSSRSARPAGPVHCEHFRCASAPAAGGFGWTRVVCADSIVRWTLNLPELLHRHRPHGRTSRTSTSSGNSSARGLGLGEPSARSCACRPSAAPRTPGRLVRQRRRAEQVTSVSVDEQQEGRRITTRGVADQPRRAAVRRRGRDQAGPGGVPGRGPRPDHP
jgi:hypothetical protein